MKCTVRVVKQRCLLYPTANKMNTGGEERTESELKSGMLQSWNKFCFTGKGKKRYLRVVTCHVKVMHQQQMCSHH